MRYDFENPFADYGKMVHGERFIGRTALITDIENRIICPHNPGNLAIIGVHRIGKSSLAYKTVMEQKETLIAKKILPIWMGLASYDESSDFFRALVEESVQELEDLDWLTPDIRRAAGRALEVNATWDRIKRFFKKVQDAGYGTLFVLDEFDAARNLFKGETAFQRLRELADYPDYRLSLVLTARRNIGDIERQAGSSSPFHNIFQVQRLAMFGDEDLEAYFAQFSPVGISTSDEFRERVLFYCGAHPYLLEMLGCEIVESLRQNQEIDVDKAAKTISQSVFEHYDDMVRLMQEEGTLSKLLQILFGPAVDIKPPDVTELANYGLIKASDEGIYVAYAEHFQDYLRLLERKPEFDGALWPIWRDTEKALRNVIATTMSNVYGEGWIEELGKGRRNLANIFERCREAQQKEEKSFGDRASQNLIDFTYPAELFTIICAKGLWATHFSSIFGHNPNYWEQRKQMLARCRNPLAHNRDILQPHERKTLEAYCEEILTILADYRE